MKRFYSILLLACLILPFATTFSLLHYQKKQLKKCIKHRIIEGIDKKELVLLKFSKKEVETELEWEHSKEFEFKGEMYDVVEIIEKTDSVNYICWWDNEETILNKQLSNVFFNSWENNQKQKDQKKQLLDYSKNWINHDSKIKSPENGFQFINSNACDYLLPYKNYNSSTPSPPPRFI